MIGVPGIFDIKISEVKEIIQEARNHFGKDQTSLCVHLDIINLSLLDWYNDIIDKFSHWQKKDTKVESSDLDFIYKCTRDGTRRSIARNSEIFLEYLDRLYTDGKIKKKVKHDLEIDKIRQALKALRDFNDRTVRGKDEWLDAARSGSFTDAHINKANKWQRKLDDDVKVVDKSLSEATLALKCEPTTEEQLRKYGFKRMIKTSN
jgi:hypothetical protein